MWWVCISVGEETRKGNWIPGAGVMNSCEPPVVSSSPNLWKFQYLNLNHLKYFQNFTYQSLSLVCSIRVAGRLEIQNASLGIRWGRKDNAFAFTRFRPRGPAWVETEHHWDSQVNLAGDVSGNLDEACLLCAQMEHSPAQAELFCLSSKLECTLRPKTRGEPSGVTVWSEVGHINQSLPSAFGLHQAKEVWQQIPGKVLKRESMRTVHWGFPIKPGESRVSPRGRGKPSRQVQIRNIHLFL